MSQRIVASHWEKEVGILVCGIGFPLYLLQFLLRVEIGVASDSHPSILPL